MKSLITKTVLGGLIITTGAASANSMVDYAKDNVLPLAAAATVGAVAIKYGPEAYTSTKKTIRKWLIKHGWIKAKHKKSRYAKPIEALVNDITALMDNDLGKKRNRKSEFAHIELPANIEPSVKEAILELQPEFEKAYNIGKTGVGIIDSVLKIAEQVEQLLA